MVSALPNGLPKELPALQGFSTGRCFKPSRFSKVASAQLHYFSDASELAYGAVSYLRLVNTHGDVHCSLVTGKSRLSLLKPVTVPRLELSAAMLSTRLDAIIQDELEIPVDGSIFTTNSTCVIRYIKNEGKRFTTFIANRIASIREQSLPKQWQYVEMALSILPMMPQEGWP